MAYDRTAVFTLISLTFAYKAHGQRAGSGVLVDIRLAMKGHQVILQDTVFVPGKLAPETAQRLFGFTAVLQKGDHLLNVARRQHIIADDEAKPSNPRDSQLFVISRARVPPGKRR